MFKFIKKIDNFIVNLDFIDILLMILVIVLNFVIAIICANYGIVGFYFIILTSSFYLEIGFLRALVHKFIDMNMGQ